MLCEIMTKLFPLPLHTKFTKKTFWNQSNSQWIYSAEIMGENKHIFISKVMEVIWIWNFHQWVALTSEV